MKRVLKIFGLLFLMCLFLTGCGNNYLLEDVPVEIKGYNKDAYVVEGYEKTVDVTISGEQSDIDKIKKSKKNKVVLDLEDYDKTDKAKKFEYVFETDAINNFDSYKVNPEITQTDKANHTQIFQIYFQK
jgi:YbbR domain-containing protein